jgi:NADH-quinone oxidoreductase subunit N
MTAADLWSLAPEVWLTALAVLMLLIDVFSGPGRKIGVAVVGLVGTGLVLVPISTMLSWPPRVIFSGTLAVDGFAVFFKIIVVIATALVILASVDYFRRGNRYEGEFYALLVFMAVGLNLMAASADLILLALAIEFVSLMSYVLAGYLKSNPKSSEAGVKYFLFGAAASAVMFFGFSILYGLTGSTNLYDIAGKLAQVPSPALWLAVGMMLAGFGFKISMVPFHQWTPDVYEGAPTPVAAYLSVASKAAGFAALIRVLIVVINPQQLNWVLLIAILAALSMTLGNLMALPQRNLKRMLAYSSISHAGFILIGVAAYQGNFGTPGLLIYLFGYSFTQLGAFFIATLLGQQLGSDDIPAFAGIARRAPVPALLMAFFMLSLIGIPLTSVFIGKYFILSAAIDNGLLWLAVVAIINTVISAYYYVGVIRAMYIMPPASDAPLEEPAALQVALGLAGLGTIIIGVYPQPLIDLAKSAVLLLKL